MMPRRTRAFTLIELLVVISVIAMYLHDHNFILPNSYSNIGQTDGRSNGRRWWHAGSLRETTGEDVPKPWYDPPDKRS